MLVSRDLHPEDTTIKIDSVVIGEKRPVIIAGPCAVESKEQILSIAKELKSIGVDILRGGCYKPRTSPYSFQGIGEEGLEFIIEAKKITGMPICTEIVSIDDISKFRDVDVLQIGSRNMQNFDLLKKVAKTNKPILLKRGMSATYEEFLMAAEYILKEGNPNVILCERGIRTFETYTRNTLDLQAIPVLRRLTHLPIIVDPSHAAGKAFIVPAMAHASIAAGAEGLEIEVHNDIENCMCDKEQAISIEEMGNILKTLHNAWQSYVLGYIIRLNGLF